MMKTKKGYSLIVLAVAITVILILVSSAVSVLQNSREKTKITNFIFDITTVEEMTQNFYTSTGTLPVKSYEEINMLDLNASTSKGILTQLHSYDNEKYYDVDLSKLGDIFLKDSEREYIVNEGSLKVYVKNGVEYTNFEENDSKMTYYTLTSNLVNGLEQYVMQGEEMIIIGNPVVWSENANLKLVLPRQSLEATGADSWKYWTFKWDFGPKTEAEMEAISDSDTARNFEYGDILNVKSNGIYSIYVKDPAGNVTLMNINVSKIDDISPTYKLLENNGVTNIQIMDNETGIKNIKYKTLKQYNENKLAAEKEAIEDDLKGRTSIDYYLVDGIGKDILYDLEAEISTYNREKNTIEKAKKEENDRYNRWLNDVDKSMFTQEEMQNEANKHDTAISEFNEQLNLLDKKYPYIMCLDGIPKVNDYGYTPEESECRLVVYVEDYSGNGKIIGLNEVLSTKLLANSFNISL